MIASDDKKTLMLLKRTKAFLESVDIHGFEAVEYAECLEFLKSWISISEKSPENSKIRDRLKKRRERYKQKKADLEAIISASTQQTDSK